MCTQTLRREEEKMKKNQSVFMVMPTTFRVLFKLCVLRPVLYPISVDGMPKLLAGCWLPVSNSSFYSPVPVFYSNLCNVVHFIHVAKDLGNNVIEIQAHHIRAFTRGEAFRNCSMNAN